MISILPPSWKNCARGVSAGARTAPRACRTAAAERRRRDGPGRKFDFVIINELFERALFDLKAIVHPFSGSGIPVLFCAVPTPTALNIP